MARLDIPEESIEERFVTVAEAARYLGVGRKVVYQLVEYGRVLSVRRRRVLLVDRESLEEFRRTGGLT